MADQSAGRAFIGSFTSAGGRGIVTAAVDLETGALTETGASGAVPDPSYLAAVTTAAGTALYTVSERTDGAVAAFDVTGAAPRPIGEPMLVGAEGPTHLAVSQGHLLTANYGSGSVSVLPIGTDGAPGPVGGVMRHKGSGPVLDRQDAPHAHQVLPDPSGRWVLSVDLGTDSVRICALDTAADALVLHGETALRPGTGPRHLAFHPAGRHAYVLGELEPTVTVCRWARRPGPSNRSARPPCCRPARPAPPTPPPRSSHPTAAGSGPRSAATTASPCWTWTRRGSGRTWSPRSPAAVTGPATWHWTRRAAVSTRRTSAPAT